MDNEIIQIARECGADYKCETLLVNGKDAHDFIERFYREAQRMAFEKAAKACEKSDRYRGDYFAATIRQLGEQ